jgi:glycosyltransferase involved in cell wall biosynthesis
VPFEARIVGDGPLRPELERLAGQLGIAASLTFTGHLPSHEVWTQLAWADVLLHTGVVAPSGDRDGLPNVIPEAMCVGVMVVTSPAAATTEAVTDGVSGVVAAVDQPGAWVEALRSLATDDARAERFRTAARRWVEDNYNAHDNAARLLTLFRAVIGQREKEIDRG